MFPCLWSMWNALSSKLSSTLESWIRKLVVIISKIIVNSTSIISTFTVAITTSRAHPGCQIQDLHHHIFLFLLHNQRDLQNYDLQVLLHNHDSHVPSNLCKRIVQSLNRVWFFCDPMDHSPPGSSCPWDFPGKNIGVGCFFLLYLFFSFFDNVSNDKWNLFQGFSQSFAKLLTRNLV